MSIFNYRRANDISFPVFIRTVLPTPCQMISDTTTTLHKYQFQVTEVNTATWSEMNVIEPFKTDACWQFAHVIQVRPALANRRTHTQFISMNYKLSMYQKLKLRYRFKEIYIPIFTDHFEAIICSQLPYIESVTDNGKHYCCKVWCPGR